MRMYDIWIYLCCIWVCCVALCILLHKCISTRLHNNWPAWWNTRLATGAPSHCYSIPFMFRVYVSLFDRWMWCLMWLLSLRYGLGPPLQCTPWMCLCVLKLFCSHHISVILRGAMVSASMAFFVGAQNTQRTLKDNPLLPSLRCAFSPVPLPVMYAH